MESFKIIGIFCVVILVVDLAASESCYSCVNFAAAAQNRKKRATVPATAEQVLTAAITAVTGLIGNLNAAGVDTSLLVTSLNTIVDQLSQYPSLASNQALKDLVKALVTKAQSNGDAFDANLKTSMGKVLDNMATGASTQAGFLTDLVAMGIVGGGIQGAGSGTQCDDPFDKTQTGIATCQTNANTQCGKIKVATGSTTSVFRTCLAKVSCDAPNYYCCTGADCNSATKIGAFNMAAAIVTVLVTLVFNF